nr:hypothetical protein [Streptomyces sp. CRN 30]
MGTALTPPPAPVGDRPQRLQQRAGPVRRDDAPAVLDDVPGEAVGDRTQLLLDRPAHRTGADRHRRHRQPRHRDRLLDLRRAARQGPVEGERAARGLPPLNGIASGPATAAAVGFVVLRLGAIVVHLTGADRRIALDIGLLVGAAAAVRLSTVRW